MAAGSGYAGQPRPAVIVQDDRFDTDSVTICPCTTDPTEQNGLRDLCRLMVDRVTTVSRSKLAERVGSLGDADVLRLNRALVVFLGIAG